MHVYMLRTNDEMWENSLWDTEWDKWEQNMSHRKRQKWRRVVMFSHRVITTTNNRAHSAVLTLQGCANGQCCISLLNKTLTMTYEQQNKISHQYNFILGGYINV